MQGGALEDFFAREWALAKRMDYGEAGGRGSFEGVARFVKVAPNMLWYKEEGTMKLANGAVTDNDAMRELLQYVHR